MYGCLTSTYESGYTRLFLYGRTDTIRASSIESLAFCKAMLDPSVTVSLHEKCCQILDCLQESEKFTKMKAAIESHRLNAIEVLCYSCI